MRFAAKIRRLLARLLYAAGDRIGGLDSQAERQLRDGVDSILAKLACGSEDAVERADEEADRRDRMGLLNYEVPRLWHSFHYLRQGYRLGSSADPDSGHQQGGEPRHRGAECPICKRPFLLFWDIDCADSRFRAESAPVFGDLKRLPLYYCCRRPEPTIYRVEAEDRIRTFTPELVAYEEGPFSRFPQAFPRKPLHLKAIPPDIENLLAIALAWDPDWLRPSDRERLAEYFGHPVSHVSDLRGSQLGGLLASEPGHQEYECPNPACATHKMGHPILRPKRHYQMKELAVIDADAGFDMKTNCAQIVFRICWKCLTIRGDYRVD